MVSFIHFRSGTLVLAASTLCASAALADEHVGTTLPSIASSFADLPQFGSALVPQRMPGQGAELGTGFARPSSMSLEQVFDNFDRRQAVTEQLAPDGSSIAATFEQAPLATDAEMAQGAAPQMRLTAFSLVSRRSNGQEYAVGVGGMAASYFGAGGLRLAAPGTISALPALGNPYFSLASSASHAGVSRDVGGIRIKFGILKTGLNHAMATRAFDPDSLSPALMTAQPRMNARVLEFSKSFERTALSFSLMRSKERNPAPGMPRSVTSFGSGAATSSAQLTGVWLLAPKIALAAQASYGRTPGSSGAGLGADSTNIRSNAFALGVVASDRYRRGDRLSLSVSQPIRAYYGQEAAQLGSGGIDHGDMRLVSLVPTGRELLAEMNYVTPIGKTAYAGWTLSLRRNPNNIAEAPVEKLLGVRYMQQF